MKRITKWMFAAIFLCGTLSAQAQVDPQVTQILKKCQEKMTDPRGVETTMTLDVGLVVKIMSGTITTVEKGNKMKAMTTMKIMGKSMTMETGFDGTQQWEYIHTGKKDTVTITKTTQKPQNEHAINFNLDKVYKTAKAKLNGQFYELTFTNPIKKDWPKKQVMKIDKDKYYFNEVKSKEEKSGATMTLKLTKIKIGVSDEVFKFNPKNYPNAVIVRK
ncbi:MAG: hypothetical protein IKW98_04565 [Prevotella sp.]|nr:hypothetical protein [Prevotella sp.]